MATAWDAFISYARAASEPTADALQRGLERFARPWHQRRAIRVFRDDRALTANPALWSTIEQGLREARFLVVVLSPAAAASGYVDREVGWWVSHKGAESVLLVLDDGRLDWDRAAGGFTAASTVPPSLRSAFTEEPRWLDLRWFAGPDDTADPRFAEALADLSAPIRSVDRDELIGDDLVQHRRLRRLTRGAVVALTGLLAVSVVATAVAVRQRDDVIRQATTLRARQLAGAATGLADADLMVARLLAVEAYRTEDSLATRQALLETAVVSPYLDHFARFDAPVTAIAASRDGATVAVGLEDGRVFTLGATAGATPRLRFTAPGPVTSLRADQRGDVLLASTAATVQAWERTGVRPLATHLPVADAVALSASGRFAAVLMEEGERPLVVHDLRAGTVVAELADPLGLQLGEASPYPQYTSRIAFLDDDVLRLVSNDLRWVDLDLGSGAVSQPGSTAWAPYAELYATSPDAAYLLAADITRGSEVRGWSLAATGPELPAALRAPVPLTDVLGLAISPDGAIVLANDSSGLYATASLDATGEVTSSAAIPPTRIPGVSGVTAAEFLTPDTAVAAVRSGLAFLHFGPPGAGVFATPLQPRPQIALPSYASDHRSSAIAPSPDGTRLAVLELALAQLEVVPLSPGSGGALAATALEPADSPPLGPFWLDDRTVLVLDSATGGPVAGLPDGVAHWHVGLDPSGSDEPAVAVAAQVADGTVRVAFSDGTVHSREVPSGRLVDRVGQPGAGRFDLGRFSADGRYLALVDLADTADELDEAQPVLLLVVDVATGAVVQQLTWPSATAVAGVEFAGDTLVVSRVDGAAELLPDLGRGEPVRLTSGGTRTSTGSAQATPPVAGPGVVGLPTRTGLQLYDLATGQALVMVPAPPGLAAEPRSYAFSPDGPLVTAYFGGTPDTAVATVRSLDTEELSRQACADGGTLSGEEWSRLVGGDPPAQPGCR